MAPSEKPAALDGKASSQADSSKPSAAPKESESRGRNGFLRVFNYGSTSDYVLESIGVLAAIGSGVALAMVNLVIGRLINLLSGSSIGTTPPDLLETAANQALFFVYIGIARLVLTYVYASILTYVSLKMTRNLRHAYLRSALSQEVSYFDQGSSGSIAMQATSNGKLVQSGIAEKLGQVFQAAATFVAAFIIAFVTQWKLTLILICMIPALLAIGGGIAVLDAKIETRILKAHAQAASFAEAVLGSVRTTHAFNLGQRMVARYEKHLQYARDLGDKKNSLYGIMFAGEYFVMFAGMGLAFWQGIAMIARGEAEDVGTIFIVLFSVVIAASQINSVSPHFVTFSRASTAASELFSLIDRESEINPFDASGEKPAATSGNIEFEGVTFSYPTRPDVRVLEDFNLKVPAGKVTALVGASGSGKSTIVGLLERWYNQSAGNIRLDGLDIDRLNIKWLRTNIRLVQQEPVLFNCSVFENIANGLVGTPGEAAPIEEQRKSVKAAAQSAFADEFIESLPQGYDTRIGERGGLLSGGQKQRIAIARSIISEPKILLLDEATSALDPQSEAVVQKALDEASKSRTTITIAHKLKTIREADNIVVMAKGKIEEQGTHEELVARGSTYSNLVKAQDLSPQAAKEDSSSSDDDNQVLLKESRSRGGTEAEEGRLLELSEREDFSLFQRTGLIRSIIKLFQRTPELWVWYFVSLIGCLAGAGMYPGQTILLGNVLNVFTAPDMRERGNFISLMFFVMSLGLAVVFFFLGWTTNVISQTLTQRIRRDLFSAILRQDLRFFDRPENTVGSLVSRIDSHAQSIFELMGISIAIVFIALVAIVACGILSIATSWKLGLVGVFAGIPPMVVAGYVRIRTETKMDSKIDRSFSNSASVASESVNAIRTVSSLAIEEAVLRGYTEELDHASAGAKSPLFTMMIFFAFTQSVEYFVLALGFWWGSKLLSQGDINFYELIVSFMAVYFAGQGAGQMFSFASSFTKACSAANYYFWICDLEPTIRETPENRERQPAEDYASYDFSDVKFAYPLAPDNRVLKGISLSIKPGQFVAFVGASGCGKSTMISLLERFYDPTSGQIIIDGSEPLTTLNPILYRRRIALVQQEPVLFPISIRDNIALGVDMETDGRETGECVDDDMIETACRTANAWDFISSLPDGLNTQTGFSGSQLSGGQRQRIAIARALVRNPSIILLDEATSALDTESERIIQAALMEAASVGDRITIAVAHRLSTVRYADRIFVFYAGRIAEAGSHEELIRHGGMYKTMCEAQSLDTATH